MLQFGTLCNFLCPLLSYFLSVLHNFILALLEISFTLLRQIMRLKSWLFSESFSWHALHFNVTWSWIRLIETVSMYEVFQKNQDVYNRIAHVCFHFLTNFYFYTLLSPAVVVLEDSFYWGLTFPVSHCPLVTVYKSASSSENIPFLFPR